MTERVEKTKTWAGTWVLLLILTACLVLMMASCKHEPLVGSTGSGGGTGPGFTGVCFESDLLPLIQSSCGMNASCHGTGTREGLLISYETIMSFDGGEGIKKGKPLDSDIYKEVLENKMPKGGPYWDDRSKELLRKWIVEGANNTTGCSTCDTATFTFKAVQAIMAKNCVSCHQVGDATNRFVSLKDYTGVLATVTKKTLVPAVEQTGAYPMPKAPQKKLESCDITVIKKWVAAGAPNN